MINQDLIEKMQYQFLFEGKKEAIQQYVTTGKIDQKLFDKLLSFDTTKTFKYISWLCKMVSNGYERTDHLGDVIGNFNDYVANQTLKGKQADINQYKTVEQLEKILADNTFASELMVKGTDNDEYEKKYEDKDILVVRPNTWGASKKYGKGTKWCVASEENSGHWHDYALRGWTFYFVINKKDPVRKFAININSDTVQAWNPPDSRVLNNQHDIGVKLSGILDSFLKANDFPQADKFYNKLVPLKPEQLKYESYRSALLANGLHIEEEDIKAFIPTMRYFSPHAFVADVYKQFTAWCQKEKPELFKALTRKQRDEYVKQFNELLAKYGATDSKLTELTPAFIETAFNNLLKHIVTLEGLLKDESYEKYLKQVSPDMLTYYLAQRMDVFLNEFNTLLGNYGMTDDKVLAQNSTFIHTHLRNLIAGSSTLNGLLGLQYAAYLKEVAPEEHDKLAIVSKNMLKASLIDNIDNCISKYSYIRKSKYYDDGAIAGGAIADAVLEAAGSEGVFTLDDEQASADAEEALKVHGLAVLEHIFPEEFKKDLVDGLLEIIRGFCGAENLFPHYAKYADIERKNWDVKKTEIELPKNVINNYYKFITKDMANDRYTSFESLMSYFFGEPQDFDETYFLEEVGVGQSGWREKFVERNWDRAYENATSGCTLNTTLVADDFYQIDEFPEFFIDGEQTGNPDEFLRSQTDSYVGFEDMTQEEFIDQYADDMTGELATLSSNDKRDYKEIEAEQQKYFMEYVADNGYKEGVGELKDFDVDVLQRVIDTGQDDDIIELAQEALKNKPAPDIKGQQKFEFAESIIKNLNLFKDM